MQNAIAAGAVSSALNPLLDIWIQHTLNPEDGSLVLDPVELSFQIFDISTDAKMIAPVQVFPASAGTKQPVDVSLASAARIAGDPGHFAALWTATVSPPAYGRYEIRWFFKTVAGGFETQVRREFDVLQGGVPLVGARGYCSVSDLRDEGVLAASVSDVRLLRTIRLATEMIDRITGRFFDPRLATITLNGRNGRTLQLDTPIIALLSVTMGQPPGDVIGPSAFRVFNRHILQGPSAPDDRANPMIEFLPSEYSLGGRAWVGESTYFPSGVQNVNVRGLFGYTDFDGSPTGETPMLIRHACKLLTIREMRAMTDDEREDRDRWRLTSERTRDQSWTAAPGKEGPFTGDQEIDQILAGFMRGPRLGSA